MKKKECPSCAMEIESDLKTCPICQYEFPETDPTVKWVAIILIIAILLGIFFWYSWS
jgi:RNA polymerase subunit RPABC4/transcription elongation factor Spt4